jgi:hypothetical protein
MMRRPFRHGAAAVGAAALAQQIVTSMRIRAGTWREIAVPELPRMLGGVIVRFSLE